MGFFSYDIIFPETVVLPSLSEFCEEISLHTGLKVTLNEFSHKLKEGGISK